MNSKQQGAKGISQAINFYMSKGCSVFIPVCDINRYDLLVDDNDSIFRVEVKTTMRKNGEFSLRTKGGNQSWNGEVKKISCSDCDKVLLVNLFTGNQKEYNSSELVGKSTIAFR